MEKGFILYWFIIPIGMLLWGTVLTKFPPKTINSFWGYRTRRSSQSIEAWSFAQKSAGKYFCTLGIVILAITAVTAYLTVCDYITSNLTTPITLLQLIAVLTVVPRTETNLKHEFE